MSSSSSSKSFLIKDILSNNCHSILSNKTEDILSTKSIDLQRYFNNIEQTLYPLLLPPSILLLLNDIKNSSLNVFFEMNKKIFDNSNISTLNHDVSFKLTEKSTKRKRRKHRTAFTTDQIYALEKRFTHQKYLTSSDRDQIANELRLSAAQVITWFQNRRAKLRRDYKEFKDDVNPARKIQVMEEHIDFI